MVRICVAAAVALTALTAQAQVYKCKVDGKTVFSDQPCAPDAKQINVRPAAGYSPTAPTPGSVNTNPSSINSSNNPQAVVARMQHEIALRDADQKIQSLRAKITEEQDSMNREVAALRNQKSRANNNLAGATWEQAITGEMSAVVARYDVRIRALESEIKQAEDERSRLLAAGN